MGTGDFSLHLRKLARGAGVVGALAKQLRLGRGEKKLEFRGTEPRLKDSEYYIVEKHKEVSPEFGTVFFLGKKL